MKSLTYACILSALMALALGLASAQGETDSTESNVVITDASMTAPSPEKENLDQEWIEIANQGEQDISLEGWTLSDQQNHTYTFPDFVLLAGTSVKVHTGSGDDTEEDIYCNRNTPIWNNDGDIATLTDAAGNVVARYPEENAGA
ncbi:MAG TPA: lamin tail domain-containing protein [Methanotrichaceae archaeon]|nr:lamin tail domain-containing protein [Methanotrichaceae archaeon]